MSRPQAKSYDIVRVRLCKLGYAQKVTISAMVVDKPPAICNMLGVSLLAKKLQRKGADIADSRMLNQKRDIFTNDILLGSDYYMSVSRVNMPPTRLLGTFLLNTIYGQAIIGKIAGSTRLVDAKAVNQLSIINVTKMDGNMTLQDCFIGNDSF